jgi:hypothetical protein
MAHVADACPLAGNSFWLAFAKDVRRAHGRLQQSGEDAQQRGFAGAVFSQQYITTPAIKAERNLAYRGKAAKEARDIVELS